LSSHDDTSIVPIVIDFVVSGVFKFFLLEEMEASDLGAKNFSG